MSGTQLFIFLSPPTSTGGAGADAKMQLASGALLGATHSCIEHSMQQRTASLSLFGAPWPGLDCNCIVFLAVQ